MHAVLLITTFLLAIIIWPPRVVCYVCDDGDGHLHQPAAHKKKEKKSARKPRNPSSFSLGEGRRREWLRAAVTGGVPASLRRPLRAPPRSSSCYRTDDERARGWSAVARLSLRNARCLDRPGRPINNTQLIRLHRHFHAAKAPATGRCRGTERVQSSAAGQPSVSRAAIILFREMAASGSPPDLDAANVTPESFKNHVNRLCRELTGRGGGFPRLREWLLRRDHRRST